MFKTPEQISKQLANEVKCSMERFIQNRGTIPRDTKIFFAQMKHPLGLVKLPNIVVLSRSLEQDGRIRPIGKIVMYHELYHLSAGKTTELIIEKFYEELKAEHAALRVYLTEHSLGELTRIVKEEIEQIRKLFLPDFKRSSATSISNLVNRSVDIFWGYIVPAIALEAIFKGSTDIVEHYHFKKQTRLEDLVLDIYLLVDHGT